MIFSHPVFFLGEIKNGDWYVINMSDEIFVSFGWLTGLDRLLCFHGSESNEECLWWKYRKQNWRMHICGGWADCGRRRDLYEYYWCWWWCMEWRDGNTLTGRLQFSGLELQKHAKMWYCFYKFYFIGFLSNSNIFLRNAFVMILALISRVSNTQFK